MHKNLFCWESVNWNVSYIWILNYKNTWCSLSWCLNSQSLNGSCCTYWRFFLLTTLIVCWSQWLCPSCHIREVKYDQFTSFPTFFPSSPECQTGEVGTLLLANPVGQNRLDFPGLLYEATKVFGLRSRRVKLYLDQDFTQGKMEREMVDIIAGRFEGWQWNTRYCPQDVTILMSMMQRFNFLR